MIPLFAAVDTSDAGIVEAGSTDTAAPPPPLPLLLESEDAEAEAEAEAPAELVDVDCDTETVDRPLALTAPPPAAAVEVDESVDDDPDESVEEEEPEEPDESLPDPLLDPLLEPLLDPLLEPVLEPEPEPLLFTLPIVTVQVLISCTRSLPSTVIGVSFMTQVCVMSPAGVEVVDLVITVVGCPSARLRRTGIAIAGESARKRHWKRRRKAR